MNTYKVTFEDGNTVITRMNCNLEEARRYFVEQYFNFGDTDSHPEDLMLKAVDVKPIVKN